MASIGTPAAIRPMTGTLTVWGRLSPSADLRHADQASFDHAWRETARPTGSERLGHRIRQPHDLHGAGPVRQAPHEAALLECGDQAVDAGFRFEVQRFLHLVEGGRHARLLQALMDEHEQLFLLGVSIWSLQRVRLAGAIPLYKS